jgi:hypothetical protein
MELLSGSPPQIFHIVKNLPQETHAILPKHSLHQHAGSQIVGENWTKTSRYFSPFMVHPSTEPGGEGTVERVTANGSVLCVRASPAVWAP